MVKCLLVLLALVGLMFTLEAGSTKIAYKKPIYGKMSAVNEKYIKLKEEHERKSKLQQQQHQQPTPTTAAVAAISTNNGSIANATPTTTTTTSAYKPTITAMAPPSSFHEIPHIDAINNGTITTTATPPLIASPTTETIMQNMPAYCTCGIFLSSQIQRGQAHGAPVITYELDRVYPCNSIGQRQCQTKCLEKIVQHLPNAANILCATLDRDCRKERAYLFVKNCSHHWYNTSLAAGREYCCRNGQPYQCPLV